MRMPSNRKPKLSMKKAKGVHVYKCVFPNCQNFFTSTSNVSVKYCQNHARFPTTNQPRNLLLASILLIACVSFYIADAEAISLGKITVGVPTTENNKGHAVGVLLSETCIKLVKTGSKTCPSYEILEPIYDNSIKEYSGSFKFKNGFYQRESTSYKNSMGFYQHDPTFRVLVDPPKTAKLPLITIVPRLDQFHLAGQMKVFEIKDGINDAKALKSIRMVSGIRYVDDSCTYATITAVNWKFVLTDTINFMKADCDPNKTEIKTVTSIIKPITQHKVSDSYQYKLDQWKKQIKEQCLTKKGSCNVKQPER